MLPFEKFIAQFPAYQNTSLIDDLRRTDYGILDLQGHVYLDYTGGGLFAASQLHEHQALLAAHVFGNPHSYNPTSLQSTELIEQARRFVLEFFNAPADEYVCIFTQNASAALKIVGEAYPFGEGCRYLLTFDNHNSVNGIREYARAKGASVTYVPVILPDLRIDQAQLLNALQEKSAGCFNLLSFPAQSNFSGVQHPLEWIAQAQALGWDVLLDAAAFAPTNNLDLSVWKPDYVPLSFYKMFGYPHRRWARCWRARIPCTSSAATGSPAVPPPWLPCVETNITRPKLPPASRTARWITSTFRPWRSGCATCKRSATKSSTSACFA